MPAASPLASPPAPPRALAAGLRELARERPLVVTVRGGCMAPRLRDGDRVAVAPAARYWPGDVVAFRTPQGRLAVHRLLGYRLCAGQVVCVTRGDRCDLPDSPLAPERLLGRVALRPTLAERAQALLAWLALALRAARRRLAAASRRLSAVGRRLSAVGRRLSAVGRRLSAVGRREAAAARQLAAAARQGAAAARQGAAAVRQLAAAARQRATSAG